MHHISDHAFGVNYYEGLAGGCIARTLYEQEHDSDGGDDASFGTDIHTWLAAYHAMQQPPDLSAEPIPRSCSQAALVERYAKRFAPDHFGTPLLIEERLRMPVVGEGWEEPFAGTLDLIARLDAAQVAALEASRGIVLENGPGDYLVDHKTKKQHGMLMAQGFLLSPQFTGYYHTYHHFYPERPRLKGTLVNIMFRYMNEDDKQFMLLFVPPPEEEATKVWQSLVRDGAERRRTKGDTHCTPTRCFDYNRVCPRFDECPRHNL